MGVKSFLLRKYLVAEALLLLMLRSSMSVDGWICIAWWKGNSDSKHEGMGWEPRLSVL
jgi:hypothetical protein